MRSSRLTRGARRGGKRVVCALSLGLAAQGCSIDERAAGLGANSAAGSNGNAGSSSNPNAGTGGGAAGTGSPDAGQEPNGGGLTGGNGGAAGTTNAGANSDAGLTSCADNVTEPCGPEREQGICKLGARTCTDGVWSSCVGAVLAAARDCASSEDNDCDGQPDDTLDDVCTGGPRCGDGSVQAARGEECDDGGTLAGDGCTPDCHVAHAPIGASAFGGAHACMLQPSGEILCWGLNSSGQLGNAQTDNALLGPTRVLLTENASFVAVGPSNACAVHGDGQLACWGLFFQPRPTDIAGLTEVTMVALASNQVCALHRSGSVSCAPSEGAFADMGLTGVTQISAGNGQLCARQSDGALRCWGSNNAGQLGTGEFTNPSPTPLVSIPTNVAEVSAGGETTCVRLADGATQCFGAGPLGNRTAPSSTATPESVVNLPNPLKIVSASNNRCALLPDQSVSCWGIEPLGDADGLPITIDLPGRAVEIGAGSDIACAVLEDLTVYCWGPNLSILGLELDPAGAQVPVALPVP